MAITSAIMQMRRGKEEYFDPDKMHPGEWAVSTDEKYVRMCFSPGVCVRMATYEAFEEDMEQIIAILEEAKTVQEAIEKIYEEFQKAELDIEAAENSATLSESYAIGGTGTREGEDTDNAKYYAEKAKESAESFEFPVSIKNGGTGGTTAKEAQYNLLKDMEEVTPVVNYGFEDNTYFIGAYVTPTTSKGMIFKTKLLYVWNYINSKLGNICKRTVKSANATTHSNYPTDNDKIPDMSFMSYWNGAYGDGGASNLTYCKFGAFGTMATKYATDYTPVANLVTTVAGKPLDATMGKELNDRIVTLEDAFVFYTVELINGWAGELVVSINKINRQATITGYIDGTNATSTVFAKGRISATQAFTERRMPVPIQLTDLMAVDNFGTTFQRVSFTTGDDGMEVKVPSTGSLYQFNTALVAVGA